MPSPLTILFMPESAYGPTNNCVGIGKRLLDRGHRVVFAAEASCAAGSSGCALATGSSPIPPSTDTSVMPAAPRTALTRS